MRDEEKCPMVVVGNKCDLDESKRKVPTEDGLKISRMWNVPFFETSAKTCYNSKEVFLEVVRGLNETRCIIVYIVLVLYILF